MITAWVDLAVCISLTFPYTPPCACLFPVKCDNTRKVKFYTTGRGDVDVVVTDDGFKWKRKWSNLDFPIYGTLKKIEYLFFFNFSFK